MTFPYLHLSWKASKDPKRYKALFLQAKKDYLESLLSSQLFLNKTEMYQNGIDFCALDLVNLTGGY